MKQSKGQHLKTDLHFLNVNTITVFDFLSRHFGMHLDSYLLFTLLNWDNTNTNAWLKFLVYHVGIQDAQMVMSISLCSSLHCFLSISEALLGEGYICVQSEFQIRSFHVLMNRPCLCLCCLSQFHLFSFCCFKAMSLVGILL